jgi:stage V sporulation protein SpoVS
VDPITLATATSALTLLGTECAKGAASEAGKDMWSKAKSLLKWSKEPEPKELPKAIATALHDDEELLLQVVKLLVTAPGPDLSKQVAGTLVGNLRSGKTVVAQKIEGGIKM